MIGQTHIEVASIDYKKPSYSIYVAKNLDDAKSYFDQHGGIIFRDIGLDKFIVMPESLKGFSGQIDLPPTED